MSVWDSHAICDTCWYKRMRAGGQPSRQPMRFREEARSDERCCFCGDGTRSGIYIREHIDKATECRGHDE